MPAELHAYRRHTNSRFNPSKRPTIAEASLGVRNEIGSQSVLIQKRRTPSTAGLPRPRQTRRVGPFTEAWIASIPGPRREAGGSMPESACSHSCTCFSYCKPAMGTCGGTYRNQTEMRRDFRRCRRATSSSCSYNQRNYHRQLKPVSITRS